MCSVSSVVPAFRPKPRRGVSLLEVSIALTILAILLSATVSGLRSSDAERLAAVADALASDLRLAQDLAIRDAAAYTLSLTADGWRIDFAGSGPVPPLPTPPVGGDGGTAYVVRPAVLVGRPVGLAIRSADTNQTLPGVTFTATGDTAATQDTVFWLTLGTGGETRSLPLTVSAAGGAVRGGAIVTGDPPAG